MLVGGEGTVPFGTWLLLVPNITLPSGPPPPPGWATLITTAAQSRAHPPELRIPNLQAQGPGPPH